MSISEPRIRDVADVVRALQRAKGEDSERWGGIPVLVGAGCSKSAGIPLGREIAEALTVRLADRYSNGTFAPASPDIALEWLKAHSHIAEDVTWRNLYTYLFEEHFTDAREQGRIVREATTNAAGINWTHLILGELVRCHYVHTVLTTNFDQLVLEGIVRTGIIPVVADGLESLQRVDGDPQYPQVVHLHGSLHTYAPRNSRSAVDELRTDGRVIRAVQELLRASPAFVVIGYAGGEEGIMAILAEAARELAEKTIYWVQYSPDSGALSSRARELLVHSTSGGLVLGQDSDAFFAEIARGVGIGLPSWMTEPVEWLEQQAARIVPQDDLDIENEIDTYKSTLKRLSECLKTAEESTDSVQSAVTTARRLYLRGQQSEAYEILKPLRELLQRPKDAFLFGNTAAAVGDVSAGSEALVHAVEAYGSVLAGCTPEQEPALWAAAQNNLGTVLRALGEREDNPDLLRDAAVAHHAALEIYDRSEMPHEWAGAQNNLAGALARLGEREEGQDSLVEAIAAYRAALEVYTRDDYPREWAGTQGNLGAALEKVADRNISLRLLRDAEEAQEAALQIYTLDQYPRDWARTQANLGNVLARLGERTGSADQLWQAEEAHRAALQVRSRDELPAQWAQSMNNIGTALHLLGEIERSSERLEEAIEAYRAALEVRTLETSPMNWAATVDNLGGAIRLLAELEGDTEQLEKAVNAHRDALGVRTRELAPYNWATTLGNLGAALCALGTQTESDEVLHEAVQSHRSSLEVLTREQAPYEWTVSQIDLAEALIAQARTVGDIRLQEEAAAGYRAALEVLTLEDTPRLWHKADSALRALDELADESE